MKNRRMIAPSILSADFARMGEAAGRLADWGADLVHCDVMDGVFVPNITFGPKMIRDIRDFTSLPLDVHLMIVHPEKYVDAFADAGADYITVHAEACGEALPAILKKIRSRGVKCGLVLNPDTPVSAAERAAEEADMILLMSVFPGFGGQKFIDYVFPKIAEAKELIRKTGKDIALEIDGGVTLGNAAPLFAEGVDIAVAGSAVFGAADPAAAIRTLRGEE